MSKFFIHRPIFAWVIAIFVILAGVISITKLPVSQFPTVAPPTITVTATYPGATAETMTDSVLQLIEREMNGATGMMYMDTSASATGQGTLTVTFEPGTNQDLAQVDVQNRLARVQSRLPQIVQALGVRVEKSMSNFLMILPPSQTQARPRAMTSRTTSTVTCCQKFSVWTASARHSSLPPAAPCASGWTRSSCRATTCRSRRSTRPSHHRTCKSLAALWATRPACRAQA